MSDEPWVSNWHFVGYTKCLELKFDEAAKKEVWEWTEHAKKKLKSSSTVTIDTAALDAASELEDAAHQLPGMFEHVKPPCGCTVTVNQSDPTLMEAIIHLNDRHKDWSRLDIAGWVEGLDIDTEFK